MVTHDSSLARRVTRTVIIADGEVVNEYVVKALPSLTPQQMLDASRKAQRVTYSAGEVIIQEGTPNDRFYIITKGTAEVALKREDAADVIAAYMNPGQYFGEISLFRGSRTVASVRAVPDAPVEVLALDREAFQALLDEFRGISRYHAKCRPGSFGSQPGVDRQTKPVRTRARINADPTLA